MLIEKQRSCSPRVLVVPSPATVDPKLYPSKEAYDIEAVFGDKCLTSKDTKESGYFLGGDWNALAGTRQS